MKRIRINLNRQRQQEMKQRQEGGGSKDYHLGHYLMKGEIVPASKHFPKGNNGLIVYLCQKQCSIDLEWFVKKLEHISRKSASTVSWKYSHKHIYQHRSMVDDTLENTSEDVWRLQIGIETLALCLRDKLRKLSQGLVIWTKQAQ